MTLLPPVVLALASFTRGCHPDIWWCGPARWSRIPGRSCPTCARPIYPEGFYNVRAPSASHQALCSWASETHPKPVTLTFCIRVLSHTGLTESCNSRLSSIAVDMALFKARGVPCRPSGSSPRWGSRSTSRRRASQMRRTPCAPSGPRRTSAR